MMLRILKQYYPIRNIFFVIGEGTLIFVGVFIASMIIREYNTISLNVFMALKVLLVTLTCQIILYYSNLYDIKTINNMLDLGLRLMQGLGIASIFLALIYFVFPGTIIGSYVFLISIVFIFIFIGVWRYGYALVLSKGLFNQNILILGEGEVSHEIQKAVQENPDIGYTISHIIPVQTPDNGQFDLQMANQCRDACKNLGNRAKKMNAGKIVVALEDRRGYMPTQELLNCRVNGIDVLDGNTFYEMLNGKLVVKQINPSWLIFSKGFEQTLLKKTIKRALDLLISFLAGILILPFVGLVALLIKLDSKGPAIFSQERVGRHRKPYQVYKFRSMVVDAEQESGPKWAEEDDPRITRVGRIIRKLRIDELPQLWNVIKGEMSLIGPRPERQFFVEQLEKKIPYYKERFTMKPGISGWAQVCYGYGATEEDAVEKLNYDLFYIKNWSILMDIAIVFRTIKIMLFSTGAR